MTEEYERWAELADRAAIGEALSSSDEEFLRAFAESDPLARAETDVWQAFFELDTDEMTDSDVARAERAVFAVQGAAQSARRSRRTLVWGMAGGLAAAAAVALLVRSADHGAPVAQGPSVVEYLQGTARVDGAVVEKGAHLAMGSEVVAAGGPVCVAVEPHIHACLASGARVRLSQVGTAVRHVDLVEGRVAIALDPLPRGERFSVVANGVWSTAVGTAFTVEIVRLAGTVRTVVHEGKVAVGAEQGGSLVVAHKIGLGRPDGVSVETLLDHAPTETPEWAALASIANRSVEGPKAEAPVEPAETPKAEAPAEPAPETAAPAVSGRSHTITKVATATASDLLSDARQALRDQRWADAAAAYQNLIKAYPSTPEAHTAVVPLAKLQIDRLGQPAAALPSLEAYIAGGGSLVTEAQLARIRALAALGRKADEARAIDEFLAAHPSSLEADKLRTLRGTL